MRAPQETAWYGQSNHPAELESCPTCFSAAGVACVATTHVIGTGIAIGMPLSGLHAERIAVVRERSPKIVSLVKQYITQRLVS